MALAARWLDPATIQSLRTLTLAEDKHATKALRQLARYRAAPGQSREKRDARRAFERHACRALGLPLTPVKPSTTHRRST